MATTLFPLFAYIHNYSYQALSQDVYGVCVHQESGPSNIVVEMIGHISAEDTWLLGWSRNMLSLKKKLKFEILTLLEIQ